MIINILLVIYLVIYFLLALFFLLYSWIDQRQKDKEFDALMEQWRESLRKSLKSLEELHDDEDVH